MVVFPNCKINLGLHVLNKRPDGYHDIETVFYPVPFHDVLEIIRSPQEFSFSQSGTKIDGQNLCIRAVELLSTRYKLPQVNMHLHKSVPVGAGLGGGSSDAAFTISAINELFQLRLGATEMLDLAAALGSDCPFFLINKPCLATGRGEILERLDVELKDKILLIVNPGIAISTASAYGQVQPKPAGYSLKQAILQPIQTWKEKLVNDFEMPVFRQYPEIEQIKSSLYRQGALFASMSGTGSTVYGIFEHDIDPEIEPQYFMKKIRL